MKNHVIIAALLLTLTANSFGQSSDHKAIQKTIELFAHAGDTQNLSEFELVLNENYQVVMNRLFGSEAIVIMSREVFLEKIKTKEFGGDKRSVEIEHIEINGSTAVAKVLLAGSKMSFRSILTLVENADGNWQIIGDMPALI